jgi:hypothetical protein
MDALEAVNKVCVETGVCPEGGSPLEIIRPLFEAEQMRKIEAGFNTAVAAARSCQLKGQDGIIDGYLAVADAIPGEMTDKAKTMVTEFWDLMDDEVLKEMTRNCGAELH